MVLIQRCANGFLGSIPNPSGNVDPATVMVFPDSVLINPEHAATFLAWVDKATRAPAAITRQDLAAVLDPVDDAPTLP